MVRVALARSGSGRPSEPGLLELASRQLAASRTPTPTTTKNKITIIMLSGCSRCCCCSICLSTNLSGWLSFACACVVVWSLRAELHGCLDELHLQRLSHHRQCHAPLMHAACFVHEATMEQLCRRSDLANVEELELRQSPLCRCIRSSIRSRCRSGGIVVVVIVVVVCCCCLQTQAS